MRELTTAELLFRHIAFVSVFYNYINGRSIIASHPTKSGLFHYRSDLQQNPLIHRRINASRNSYTNVGPFSYNGNIIRGHIKAFKCS